MEPKDPPEPVARRLENRLGALTATERIVAEHLEAVAAPIAAHVAAIPLFAAQPGDPGGGSEDELEATGRDVRAALLDLAAQVVIDQLEASLAEPARRAAFRDELRSLLHGGSPPHRVADPPALLATLVESPSEAEAFETDVRRVTIEACARTYFGAAAARRSLSPETAASMSRRFGAYLFDIALVDGLGFLLVYYAGVAEWVDSTPSAYALGTLVVVAGAAVNAHLISRYGVTFGKRTMELEVVRQADGRRLTFGAALLRETLGRLVNLVPFFAGYVAGASHPRRLTWGDRLAGSAVVRTPDRPAGLALRMGATAVLIVGIGLNAYGRVLERSSRTDPDFDQQITRIEERMTRLNLYATRPTVIDSEYVRDMRLILEESQPIHRELEQVRAMLRRDVLAGVLQPWNTARLSRADSIYLLMDRRVVQLEESATWGIRAKSATGSDRRRYERIVEYFVSEHDAISAAIEVLAGEEEEP